MATDSFIPRDVRLFLDKFIVILASFLRLKTFKSTRPWAAATLASMLVAALVAVLAAVPSSPARAAVPDAGGAEPSPSAMAASNARLLKPGLYRVDGAGAGTLLRFDAHGLVVVTADGAGIDAQSLQAWRHIAGGTRSRIDALVLAGFGADPAGDIARASEAGVPMVVQLQTLGRWSDRLRAYPRPAAGRLITFEDDYLLRAGGFEVEIEHVGSGRTGSDSVVLFRDLGVLAVGELFTHGVPVPDCASGGSYAGWIAAIDHLLWFDFDTVVPSRGAPVGRQELEAFKGRLGELAKGGAPVSSSGAAGCSGAK